MRPRRATPLLRQPSPRRRRSLAPRSAPSTASVQSRPRESDAGAAGWGRATPLLRQPSPRRRRSLAARPAPWSGHEFAPSGAGSAPGVVTNAAALRSQHGERGVRFQRSLHRGVATSAVRSAPSTVPCTVGVAGYEITSAASPACTVEWSRDPANLSAIAQFGVIQAVVSSSVWSRVQRHSPPRRRLCPSPQAVTSRGLQTRRKTLPPPGRG